MIAMIVTSIMTALAAASPSSLRWKAKEYMNVAGMSVA